jgi:hypothetical protein
MITINTFELCWKVQFVHEEIKPSEARRCLSPEETMTLEPSRVIVIAIFKI